MIEEHGDWRTALTPMRRGFLAERLYEGRVVEREMWMRGVFIRGVNECGQSRCWIKAGAADATADEDLSFDASAALSAAS